MQKVTLIRNYKYLRKNCYSLTFYDATDTQEMEDRPEKASLKFILQFKDSI